MGPAYCEGREADGKGRGSGVRGGEGDGCPLFKFLYTPLVRTRTVRKLRIYVNTAVVSSYRDITLWFIVTGVVVGGLCQLKLISFTNPFPHSHSYSFRTDFTVLNLYCMY